MSKTASVCVVPATRRPGSVGLIWRIISGIRIFSFSMAAILLVFQDISSGVDKIEIALIL